MIWTVLKIVLFLAVVAGLTLGAEALMSSDAGLRIAFANVEFTLGPIQMALAALLLLGALWLLLKLSGLLVATLRFINGDETAISRYFQRSRRKRGFDALTEGFIALASDDGDKALTKARSAEKLLENRTLTNLLIAQSAQAKGDTALAETYFKRLLDEDRARFVGVRGLMQQQIEAGNPETARKLAETALTLRPGHGQTQDTLMALQNKAGDWSGARRTLLDTSRSGRLPKPVYKRRDAVLTLQQAQAEAKAGRESVAQDLAIEAAKHSPELVPAAVMAAEALTARGKKRAAAKVIRRAWKAQPHPELARAFAGIEADETAAERVRRFDSLLSMVEGDEARQTRAELLIAAEDFPAARRAIGDLHERLPSQRVMTIMAAIERGEGSPDTVVRGWLARALTAPRGPQWVCENCQHVHASWHALCDNCTSFDTLSWKSPPDSTGPSATGTEMLPLIVGALPAAEPQVAEPEVEIDLQAPEPPEPAAAKPEAEEAETIEPEATPEPADASAAPPADAPTAEAEPAPTAPKPIDLEQTRRAGL
ncbi:heme biosynthesis protein HemY [Pararhodobacter oceanensis]|uniref:Heme biosynthesis protein HemY n=1 Tax=Pararhodobacter oceanensis TaxID=2172121 RepID=A0A2T8HQK2_9RHOB|nr:heme biosynthesis HemY N-terminal domain-containing protein [Pararhodobacter oceanensis]PVH27728.1 heme biosynthesis protein HemY [Pararhodobacter oceanensis]